MHLDHAHLPPTIRRIVALIGLADALALVEAHGGQRLIFSKGVRREGMNSFAAVSEVVGEKNALALAEAFGGEPTYIAKCADAIRAVRNSQWRERFDRMTRGEGMSARQAVACLAREPRALSDRKMWDVINRPGDPVRKERDFGQGKLF